MFAVCCFCKKRFHRACYGCPTRKQVIVFADVPAWLSFILVVHRVRPNEEDGVFTKPSLLGPITF